MCEILFEKSGAIKETFVLNALYLCRKVQKVYLGSFIPDLPKTYPVSKLRYFMLKYQILRDGRFALIT